MPGKRSESKTLERQHRIARILVEAALTGDEATASRNGLSLRTIGRYRAVIESSKGPEALEVTRIVRQKMELLDQDFSISVGRAMNALADYMRRCADELAYDHRGLRAAAGAMKLGGERHDKVTLLKARLQNTLTGEPMLKAVKPPKKTGEGES